MKQCGKLVRRATIFVRDAEASAAFYCSVFGFTVYSDQKITLREGSPVTLGAHDRPRPARFITVKGAHDFTGMIGLISLNDEQPKDTLADGRLGVGNVVLVMEAEDIDTVASAIEIAGGTLVMALHDAENTAGASGEKIPSRRFFAKDLDGYVLEVFEPQ
ncbi:MAG: VOC family protein [Pseudomonadota bacterium]